MKTIKLFEMFAGYGGASFGLKKADIPFECVGFSEIDKYAIQCFEQNHEGKNFGDCSKINPKDLPDFDLLTGGFPCQDVSIAGNRDLSKGRTNLYQEIIRIADARKPKYMLLENVKGLLSMEIDEVKLVQIIVRDLQKIGYGVCWKVLNSKDYGIPQNRERIWFVCKLGGWDFMEFMFPNPIKLELFLKDILEKEIDEKYYISKKLLNGMKRRMKEKEIPINPSISGCICARYEAGRGNETYIKTRDINKAINTAQSIADKEQKPVQLDLMHLQHGEIRPLSTYIPQDLDTHRCLQSGEPKEVLVEPYSVAIRNKNRAKHQNKLGKNYGDFEKDYQLEKQEDVSYAVKSSTQEFMVSDNQSIRRLTPKECFRLMGFLNDDINLDGISDTQRYKLAGNGWDINLVSKIFRRMSF